MEDLLGPGTTQPLDQEVGRQLRMQAILVTGAAGSIGSELVHQLLLLQPRLLILVDQAESGLFELILRLQTRHPALCNHTALIPKLADVACSARMEDLFRQYHPEYVFHAAAYKHVPLMEAHPAEAIRVNVLGTVVTADLALRYQSRKFMLVSTDKAVNPSSVMGATKRLAEMYIQSLNPAGADAARCRFMAARFGNVLGSSGSVVRVFAEQIRAGGPVTVKHPEASRYFMTIPEACQLMLEGIVMGQGGEVFMFDMGEPLLIIDLARKMIQKAGLRPQRDIAITFTGLRPGEKLHEELTYRNESLRSTHHPKIKIARALPVRAGELHAGLSCLPDLTGGGKNTQFLTWLSENVPEYVRREKVPLL
ncbi:polysaccharide biosynthesis protein [Tellurirhabdus rosea]|uniref:polysaccharide biosynthesis protein n=1 Tax=Tellurirhabdus rosea TaxID=2674997 RepID=UPI002258E11C|nr:polysaccharide biosynthesis protein [Tellurirhabdus rosea]